MLRVRSVVVISYIQKVWVKELDCMLPVAGLERVPYDPWLPRRAFLRHPLHRNLPRLPSGEPNSRILEVFPPHHHPIKPWPKPHQPEHGSELWKQPNHNHYCPLTIASSHSCHEFLFEIIPSAGHGRCGQIPLLEVGSVFIEWGRGLSLDHSSSYLQGLSASVFIDSPNPPLTPYL